MSRWNREAAMLGIPDLPEGAFEHVGDRKIKPQGGGGGGGTTTSTNYTSSVPEWARPQFETIMGRGLALSETPYQAYQGERVAQFTPLQQQAFQGAENQQVAGQVGLGSGLAAMSGLSSFTNPGTAQQFMSPFIMNALAPQLQEQARQSAIQGTQQQADAVGRGAFGGSRDAIMRAERERNLGQLQSDTLARGLQTAFESGQGQFNQEQATRLQAAGALGQLGQTQFGQQMDITNLQNQMGGLQQSQIQRILDQQYADFQQQRDFPYQQLGFASDLLRGAGGTSRSIYTTPQTSPLQTLAGLGTAAAGLGRMAKGGEVKRYASGGITSALGDQALAQRAQQPQTPMGGLAAANEMVERAALRNAAPGGIPGLTPPAAPQEAEEPELTVQEIIQIRDEALAKGDMPLAAAAEELLTRLDPASTGIATAAPEAVGTFAEGGIVGYQEGGGVRSPYSPRRLVGDPESEQLFLDQFGRDARVASLVAGRQEPPAEEVNMRPIPRALRGLAQLGEQNPNAPRGTQRGEPPQTRRLGPIAGVPSAARDALILERQDPRSGGLDAALRATEGQFRVTEETPAQTPDGGGSSAASVRASAGVRAPDIADFGFDVDAFDRNQQGGIAAWQAAEKARVQGSQADFEEMVANRGVFGEERAARLNASLEGLADEKEKSKAMALFQAGLSILAADPSKGAWSAIGTGALQGLGAYKGDLREIETKRENLINKMDEIEDVRRQEAVADDATRMQLRDAERALESEGAKMYYELSRDIGMNVRMPIAKTVFEETMAARRLNAELASRESMANAQLRSSGERNRLDALFNSQTRMLEYAERVRTNALKEHEPFLKTLRENEARGLPPNPQQVARYNQIMEEVEQRINSTLGPNFQNQLAIIQRQIDAVAGVQTPTANTNTSGFRVLGVE